MRDTTLEDGQLGLLVYGLYQTRALMTKTPEDQFYLEIFHISANYMRKKFGNIDDELFPYLKKEGRGNTLAVCQVVPKKRAPRKVSTPTCP